jgi:hypothetical protein
VRFTGIERSVDVPFRYYLQRRPALARVATPLLLVGALCATSLTGCNGSPQAPTARSPMVSGCVYQLGTAASGEARLGAVLITVEQADGAGRTTFTDAEGLYTLTAVNGAIAISATKVGFATNRQHFELSGNTTLNFSLALDDGPS